MTKENFFLYIYGISLHCPLHAFVGEFYFTFDKGYPYILQVIPRKTDVSFENITVKYVLNYRENLMCSFLLKKSNFSYISCQHIKQSQKFASERAKVLFIKKY